MWQYILEKIIYGNFPPLNNVAPVSLPTPWHQNYIGDRNLFFRYNELIIYN